MHKRILHISVDNGYSSSIERKKAYELFMSKYDLSPEIVYADQRDMSSFNKFLIILMKIP